MLRITHYGRTNSLQTFTVRHGIYTTRFMTKLALWHFCSINCHLPSFRRTNRRTHFCAYHVGCSCQKVSRLNQNQEMFVIVPYKLKCKVHKHFPIFFSKIRNLLKILRRRHSRSLQTVLKALGHKIYSPRRTDARNLCPPDPTDCQTHVDRTVQTPLNLSAKESYFNDDIKS